MARHDFAYTIQRVCAFIIPCLVAGAAVYGVYIVTARIGVEFLIQGGQVSPKREAAGIVIIVFLYILFLPMAVAYLRFIVTVLFNTGYLPQNTRPPVGDKSLIKGPDGTFVLDRAAVRTHLVPFPPGYERFSRRQVFSCAYDGLPRFCNLCWAWKRDRSHHCTEVQRCVRKFDHFCPWVGGVVSETNAKFFVQFSGYATFFTVYTFIVILWAILTAKSDCNASPQCEDFGSYLDGQWIAGIVLSSVFGLMTFGIFTRHGAYVLANQTTIENLDLGNPRNAVAVRIEEWELPLISTDAGYLFTTFPINEKVNQMAGAGGSGVSNEKANDTSNGQSVGPQVEATGQNGVFVENLSEKDVASPTEAEVLSRTSLAGQDFETEPPTAPSSPLGEPSITNHPSPSNSPAEATSKPSPYVIFIILFSKPGLNIWNIGTKSNIRSTMGNSILDWFLPFRLSPSLTHEDGVSDFPLGEDFYKMEKAALPNRYDERGRRKESLYSRQDGNVSAERRRSRRRRRGTRRSSHSASAYR